MQQVFRQIALVADSDLCVLITGESGTGKELVAAAIHRHSRRCDQAYLAVTPVGASEPAIQREWFGDLNHDQKGAFELAHGGTLLLDEIGDLPRSLQVKLLRVLEQQAFTQVGAVKPSRCDVRCIASTKRDLHQAVNQGEFGEDLLYRLSAVSIHLPPLRGRLEDIPMLCEFFLRRLGYPSPSNAIDDKTMQHLQSRKWWGNVRELRNAVDHASVIARGRPLEIADFPPPQSGNSPTSHSGNASPLAVIEQWTQSQLENSNDKVTDLHEKFLAAVEPALLKVVLQHTDGNRAAAAELLGIHRGTLRERLKRYGID